MENEVKLYDKWKSVTEADFVSLFIKTWFAYISTLRTMFPEAQNRRGDGKYLKSYKAHYLKTGYKKFIIDETMMNHIELLYRNGREVIMKKYPEYYLWDFYRINEDFKYTFSDLPPDKSDCLIVGLKMYRNRGTKFSFVLSGYVKFFGEYYKENYEGIVKFKVNISDIVSQSPKYIRDNPNISEQEYLSLMLHEISVKLSHEIVNSFLKHLDESNYGKRIVSKVHDIEKHSLAIIWSIFSINAKDDSLKTKEDMQLSRNSYEIIHQLPINYFEYHMDVSLYPQRKLTSSEKEWYNQLSEQRRQNSILWFLDFVYRLRNALFHEIIDPLDEQWQMIFKNAYLVLKELVDLNIQSITDSEIYHKL